MLNVLIFIYKGKIKLQGDEFQNFLRLSKRFQLKLQDEQDNRKKPKLSVRASINDLPPEVLTRIFSYLPTFDVLQNIGRVSKKFHDLSRHPRSHIDVCFTFTKTARVRSVVDFLRNANLMIKLNIIYTRQDQSYSRPMFPDLEGVFDPNADILLQALRKNQHLKSLDFSANYEHGISAGKTYFDSMFRFL